ncbi:dTDP-4-dehydrorhamnose 3,5-epimerase family protein [Pollutimonas sp. M17]|uniref:dTDP-4-dehydrorhamnose 3,5-epimerase family protein n=1 Tax=Pollutimonas sp. M17 TaxID=2962065 RepID=UPI0021F3F808|nr:dTDP-4-dehydrorhamnose 3,5-epimerase family protein [Pollutimonas sp. M17]UYO94998.1 dTDP-4-dehydrorhamnose 3,5-epimerase family protein [Pollutimonas sp. M17]
MKNTNRFELQASPISGLLHLKRKPIQDDRGFFSRFYCQEEFSALGLPLPVQINHSMSKQRGTIRGMHFQYAPHAETKIVSCLQGSIFDVAIDLRAGSPTYLQWHGLMLSAELQNSLVVPPGVAHGFQTLEANAQILYLVSTAYSATDEDGVNPLDPAIAIDWPLPVGEISQRDQQRPFMDTSRFHGLGAIGERSEL